MDSCAKMLLFVQMPVQSFLPSRFVFMMTLWHQAALSPA